MKTFLSLVLIIALFLTTRPGFAATRNLTPIPFNFDGSDSSVTNITYAPDGESLETMIINLVISLGVILGTTVIIFLVLKIIIKLHSYLQAKPANGNDRPEIRNQKRLKDLARIQKMLDEYHKKHGAYPNSEEFSSIIQTEINHPLIDPLNGNLVPNSSDYFSYGYDNWDEHTLTNNFNTYRIWAFMEEKNGKVATRSYLRPGRLPSK